MHNKARGSIRVFLTITFIIALGAWVFWPEAPVPEEEITVAFIGDTYLKAKPSLPGQSA